MANSNYIEKDGYKGTNAYLRKKAASEAINYKAVIASITAQALNGSLRGSLVTQR